jgi:hypothetical protein
MMEQVRTSKGRLLERFNKSVFWCLNQKYMKKAFYLLLIFALSSCAKPRVITDSAYLEFSAPNSARMYFNTCEHGKQQFLNDTTIKPKNYYIIQWHDDECRSIESITLTGDSSCFPKY